MTAAGVEVELRGSWIRATDPRVVYEHPALRERGGLDAASIFGMFLYYYVPRGVA